MRIISYILLFLSISSVAQNTALEIRIDSITSYDSSPKERKFTINYHIQNITESPISFILDLNSIRPNATSSRSYQPSYRLYQGDEIVNTIAIFNSNKSREKVQHFLKEKRKIDFQTLREKMKKEMSESIVKSIVKLNPKEIKNCSITLDWDKNRFTTYFDNEYYLDEKATHYFDLCINLLKEELKESLLPEDFKKVMEDKTIIKGWAQSNKMEINFKE